jgi:hypothetical protein
MGNHNQDTLHEMPRNGGELDAWSQQSLAVVLDGAYASAMGAFARMPDVTAVPMAAEMQPDPSEATERLQRSVPFVPASEVEAPHVSDSQVVSAAMGTNGPEAMDRFVDRPPLEAYALQQVEEAFGTEAGPAVNRPVAAAPVQPSTQEYPDDKYFYGNSSLGDIRGNLAGLYDEPEA